MPILNDFRLTPSTTDDPPPLKILDADGKLIFRISERVEKRSAGSWSLKSFNPESVMPCTLGKSTSKEA